MNVMHHDMRRRVWLLLAAFAAGPAHAQIATDYRLPPAPDPPLRLEVRVGCPPATSENEAVVCGRRQDELYRVPPSERAPSAAHRAGGEQLKALADGTPSRCTTVGPNQQCTRGLDMMALIFGIVRAVGQARANRD